MRQYLPTLATVALLVTSSQAIQSGSGIKSKLQNQASLPSWYDQNFMSNQKLSSGAVYGSSSVKGLGGDFKSSFDKLKAQVESSNCDQPSEAPTLPPSQDTTAACDVTEAPTEAPTLPPSQDTTQASCTSAEVTTEAPTLPPSQDTTQASCTSAEVTTEAPATTEASCTSAEVTTEAPTLPPIPPSQDTTEAACTSAEVTTQAACTTAPVVVPTLPPIPPSQDTTQASCTTAEVTTQAACTQVAIPTLPPIPPSESTTQAACTTAEVTTQAACTTAAPTDAPIPTPSQNTPGCECTAENTPNWKRNDDDDCNYVYNATSCGWDCIYQTCSWQFNSSDCSWSCIDVPQGNSSCELSCDEVKALEDRLASIEKFLNLDNLGEGGDNSGDSSGSGDSGSGDSGSGADNGNASADGGDAGNNGYSYLQSQINSINAAITDIYGIVGYLYNDIEGYKNDSSSRDAAVEQAVRDDIRSNGLYFGDRWWLGQQQDQLYAIDTIESSWYQFQSGVNATLG